MKRSLESIIAILLLLLFLPLVLILSLLIRINLGSPIIFKQLRPGLHGKPFYFYKFRTMTEARDEAGQLLEDNDRLTAFGKWLRSTSLDELPQLLNVIKGDLHFIGPRPLLMEYLPLYNEEQKKRHLVKPGITGWAQVNGRNNIDWQQKLALDTWYVENRSWKLDLKIIGLTFYKVLSRKDINQKNHVTMEHFKGNNQ